jgi:hypothetical protein
VIPGRDHGDARLAAQRRGEARPLPFDRAGRTAEQHRERRGLAEVPARQRFPVRRGGPTDRQRGRPQPPLDPEPDQAENDGDDRGCDEDGNGAPARQARLSGRLGDRFALRSYARGLFGEGVPSSHSLLPPLRAAMKAQPDMKGNARFWR